MEIIDFNAHKQDKEQQAKIMDQVNFMIDYVIPALDSEGKQALFDAMEKKNPEAMAKIVDPIIRKMYIQIKNK